MQRLFFQPHLPGETHTGSFLGEIYLTPVSQNVTLGDHLFLDLWIDFSANPILGIGLDLSYDPSILQFAGFILDATLPDDPSFRNLPTNWTGGVDALRFGHFGGLGASSGKYHLL